jgi:hypothetical protein
MKRSILALAIVGGFVALSATEAGAVVCARGVYRAGCAGARGAVVARPAVGVVRRPVGVVVRRPAVVVRRPAGVVVRP